MTEVRLTPTQLNELELLRAGAYGHALRYELPAAGAHHATLLLPEDPGASVTLLDTEATPVARVRVLERSADARGTWIGGLVEILREPAQPPFPELRPAAHADLLDTATLVLGRHHGTKSGTVIVLDEGDAHQLAQSVRTYQRDGLSVRVLPAPAAQHLNADDRAELLGHLAEVLIAASVTVVHGTSQPQGDGRVVLLSGLSGSGKSTIARQLTRKMRAESAQRVTLLDGDEVRAMLSKGLGFSREDREMNVRRIGWVAAQIAAHGGIAICAPIAPYESMRAEMRAMAERVGKFTLVHVATPLEVCEARDRKGLYAKARAGEIKEFTGISDPYDEPTDADVVVGRDDATPEEAAQAILKYLTGTTADAYMI